MSDANYLLLTVNVKDDRLFTTFQPSGRHGLPVADRITPLESELRVDSVREDTIDYLVSLLERWVDSDDAWTAAPAELTGLLEVLGEHLFEVLFSDATIQTTLALHVNQLGSTLQLLRVELEFQGSREAWLSRLPWEYLRIPKHVAMSGAGQFLVTTGTELLVNRRLSIGQQAARSIEVAGKIRVLLVCSSPVRGEEQLPRVTCERVRSAIEDLSGSLALNDDLIEMPPEDAFADPDYKWRVTPASFRSKIEKFKPHVIHFIGHGRRKVKAGQLAFANAKSGEPHWLSDWDFASIVASNPDTKLVFLQACESALPDPYLGLSGVARQVAARHIPAVVGMQYRVQSAIASEFAAAFYGALADREPVDVAVQKGRLRVMDVDSSGGGVSPAQMFAFGLPVLYLRSYQSLIAEQHEQPAQVARVTSDLRGQMTGTDTTTCPTCRTVNASNALFCRKCASRLRCNYCGEPVLAQDAAFCTRCREPFEEMQSQQSQFAAARSSEINLKQPAPPARSRRSTGVMRPTTSITKKI